MQALSDVELECKAQLVELELIFKTDEAVRKHCSDKRWECAERLRPYKTDGKTWCQAAYKMLQDYHASSRQHPYESWALNGAVAYLLDYDQRFSHFIA